MKRTATPWNMIKFLKFLKFLARLICFYLLCLVRTNMDKIIETSSSFYVKQRTTGKVQFLFFKSFWLVLVKFPIWEEY